ncbi:MAG: hypothetical protein QGG89_06680, partial [Vicinamibacterales bacterium]|nr:hypothetical protein [Vicinamibacterales bacterium]
MSMMTRTHRLSLILLFGLLTAAPLASGGQDDGGVGMVRPEGEGERYWPRWRGPSGQGVVEG